MVLILDELASGWTSSTTGWAGTASVATGGIGSGDGVRELREEVGEGAWEGTWEVVSDGRVAALEGGTDVVSESAEGVGDGDSSPGVIT